LIIPQLHGYTGCVVLLVRVARRVVFSSGDLGRAHVVPPSAPSVRQKFEWGFQSAAASLFNVIFPSCCRICLSPLTNISRLPVCVPCLEQMVPMDGDGVLCTACGEKLFSAQASSSQQALSQQTLSQQASDEAPLCAMCRRAAPRFKRAVAFGSYAAQLRDLIHLFKYRQVKSAGPYLARMLDQAIAPLALPDDFLVIPVPLWPGKRRKRGFNQSEELARELVRSLTRSGRASTSIQLDTGSLVRKRDTASQTGLTRQQRQANLRGAFAVARPARVAGRTVLVVDDVMTTGTTAGECARVLLRAGAKEVFVATVARATRDVTGGMLAATA
jgi:ComF family protein